MKWEMQIALVIGLVGIEANDDESVVRRSLRDVGPEQNYIFYIVIALILLAGGLYNSCFKRRLEAEMMRQHEFHEQLYRQDVIASDQEMENTWECDVCVFKNYQTQKVCMLCGTDRGYKLLDKSHMKVAAVVSSDYVLHQANSEAELRSYAKKQLNTLNTRQKGAQRRLEWRREFDESQGQFIWKRNQDIIEKKIKEMRADEIQDLEPRASCSSIKSNGYVSKIIYSPKNPDGRLTLENAEGLVAPQTDGIAPAQFTQQELTQVSALSFQQKQAWFVQHTAAMEVPWEYGHLLLDIDRQNLLHNSCEQLLWATPEQLHQSLRIKFQHEPGVDAGGLEREWFTLMTQETFDDTTGLFQKTHESNNAFMINPLSAEASEDHLMYFQAIGRFLGRALFKGILIEAHFASPLYKHLLGVPISFSDLQFIDVDLHKNLLWMKENDVEPLCLDFTVVLPRCGESPVVVELVPNGANILVTDENKLEYIDLRMKWVMVNGISAQLASLMKGIYSVIPKEMLSVFDHQELELLMCGIPQINVADWKAHTTFLTDKDADIVRWFWEVVEEFSDEERARLLQFTTGSARVPVQGFKALTMNDGRICLFALDALPVSECLYPRAHTCFNRLDLPMYSKKEELQCALRAVINFEVTGFTME